MTIAPSFSGEAIRETFRAWNAEQESLDIELSESLAALEAYQLHLDTWQQQLVRERDDLRATREQFDRDRAVSEKSGAESSAASAAELSAAREKITALTTLLLSRTEELRTLDNRRSEVQTELELSRQRERDLKAALDEHEQTVDQERSQWAEELKQLREVLERQLEVPVVEPHILASEASMPAATPLQGTPAPKPSSNPGTHDVPRENAVLGSIVEQFGKLRQQRAVERQASNKQR